MKDQPKKPVFTASNTVIYAWAISAVTDAFINSVNQFVLPVFNTAFGLSAVMIGWAMVVPRLIDAVTDPLMGFLSDNTKTRWGRRRPYILVGSSLAGLILAVFWWASPAWGEWAIFAWLLLLLCLLALAQTIYGVPVMALGYELTDDYHQRTKIKTIHYFIASIPGLVIPWVYWLALRPELGGEVQGFRAIFLVIGILVILTGAIPAIFCRERFMDANPKKVRIWEALKFAWANRYFRQIVYMRISNATGFSIFTGITFYINVYYICGGDKSLALKIAGIGGTLWAITSFCLIPFTPWIGRKLGKHTGLVTGFGLILLLSLIQPIIQTPASPYLQLVGVALSIPAAILSNIFLGAFMPDICDLGEMDTGRREEGTYGAVANFLTKAELSLVTITVGYLITWSGFQPDLEVQPEAVLNNLRWFAYIPFFGFSLLTFWLAWRFPVDQELMERVRQILDERRGVALPT